jgi:putative ABC transport system permease protein
MKNVIEELKASSVLTREEIERIKLYINKKYPNNSSKENASILSRTIYGIVDNNLEGINGEKKQNIKKNIIQNTILNDKKNILKWDVFKAYINEVEENPELKTPLIRWINENQKNTVSQETLEEYVMLQHNKNNAKKSPYVEVKSQPIDKVIKSGSLSRHKHNFKRVMLQCKKEVSLKLNRASKKVNNQLEMISNKLSSTKIALSLLTLLILSLYSLTNVIKDNNILGDKLKNKNEVKQNYVSGIDTTDSYVKDVMSYHPYLPDYFNYKSVDKDKLLGFLNTRNSMLAEEPYFSAIIKASKEFNLNPYILFAISGQEQSFVPKDSEDAEKIANNPFNVFHSWQEYNTDIYDSSRIVARTVINLAKDKPANIDIFDWINNKYADDKNWGSGVREIFERLGE